MKVMISGHFDPFTDAHLDYIEQALNYYNIGTLVCIISSDKQLIGKKGFVNIPQQGRYHILNLILRGLSRPFGCYINKWDTDTTTIAKVIEHFKPDILFRGGDKSLADMPVEEKEVCDRMGIKIVHAEFRIDRHGTNFR